MCNLKAGLGLHVDILHFPRVFVRDIHGVLLVVEFTDDTGTFSGPGFSTALQHKEASMPTRVKSGKQVHAEEIVFLKEDGDDGGAITLCPESEPRTPYDRPSDGCFIRTLLKNNWEIAAEEATKQTFDQISEVLGSKPRGKTLGPAKRVKRPADVDDLTVLFDNAKISGPSLVQCATLQWPVQTNVAVVCVTPHFVIALNMKTDTLVVRPMEEDMISDHHCVELADSHGYDVNNLPLMDYLSDNADGDLLFAALSDTGHLQLWDVTSGGILINAMVPEIPGDVGSNVIFGNAMSINADTVAIATAPCHVTTVIHVIQFDSGEMSSVVTQLSPKVAEYSRSFTHTTVLASLSKVSGISLTPDGNAIVGTSSSGPWLINLDIPPQWRVALPVTPWYNAVGSLGGCRLQIDPRVIHHVEEYAETVYRALDMLSQGKRVVPELERRIVDLVDILKEETIEDLPENRAPHSVRSENGHVYVCDGVVWFQTDSGTLVPIEVKGGAITAQAIENCVVIQCANNEVALAIVPEHGEDPPVVTTTLLRKTVKSDEDESESRAHAADVQVVRKTIGATPRCSMATLGNKVFVHTYSECVFVFEVPIRSQDNDRVDSAACAVPIPKMVVGMSEDLVCAASAPAELSVF